MMLSTTSCWLVVTSSLPCENRAVRLASLLNRNWTVFPSCRTVLEPCGNQTALNRILGMVDKNSIISQRLKIDDHHFEMGGFFALPLTLVSGSSRSFTSVCPAEFACRLLYSPGVSMLVPCFQIPRRAILPWFKISSELLSREISNGTRTALLVLFWVIRLCPTFRVQHQLDHRLWPSLSGASLWIHTSLQKESRVGTEVYGERKRPSKAWGGCAWV